MADDCSQARQGGHALGLHPANHPHWNAFGAEAAHLPAAESDVGRERESDGESLHGGEMRLPS